MTRIRFLLALLGASVAGFTARAVEAPTTVFFVRHAEKSAPNGDIPLSAAGHARAALLATVLEPAGVSRVFSSQMIRAKQTAEPIARQLNLETLIVPVQDQPELVRQLKVLPAGTVALVVGHSNSIPAIIEKLGAGKVAAIHENVYDRLFVVTITPSGTASTVVLQFGKPTIPLANF